MAKDFLEINKAMFHCKIGCSEKERTHPQPIEISLKIYLDLSKAARSIDLNDSISWDDVLSRIQFLTESKEWILVEEFAEAVSKEILDNFLNAKNIELNVRKFPYESVQSVGVSIERTRSE